MPEPTTMLVRGIPIEDVTWIDHIQPWSKQNAGHTALGNELSRCQNRQMYVYGKALVIAAYLNEGWVPKWGDYGHSNLVYNGVTIVADPACGHLWYGLPLFRTRELARKAIELMGDDLYTLFNIPKP